MSDIREKVKKVIIDKLSVSEEQVKMDAHFVEDLGADSLDVVQLVMDLEDEFNIEISDEESEKLKTIEDVCVYIEQHSQK